MRVEAARNVILTAAAAKQIAPSALVVITASICQVRVALLVLGTVLFVQPQTPAVCVSQDTTFQLQSVFLAVLAVSPALLLHLHVLAATMDTSSVEAPALFATITVLPATTVPAIVSAATLDTTSIM